MHPTSEQRRLVARLRAALRVRRYSRRTEEAYVAWVRRFVRLSEMRHPAALGRTDVADRHRAGELTRAAALAELARRCPGLSAAAYERAFTRGLIESR